MTNAIMIPTPKGRHKAYMMPVAKVMALFRKHGGEAAIDVLESPNGLDVAASCTGDRIFLHVANTSRLETVPCKLTVQGMRIASGRVFEIAEDPGREIDQGSPDLFSPVERPLPGDCLWQFPAASVSAVELQVEGGNSPGT
jgi:hypothetical protein